MLARFRNRALFDWLNERQRCGRASDTLLQVIAVSEGLCGLCGEIVLPKDYSLDHIVPRSHGGGDHPHNLRLAHRSCNSRRGSADCPACAAGVCRGKAQPGEETRNGETRTGRWIKTCRRCGCLKEHHVRRGDHAGRCRRCVHIECDARLAEKPTRKAA
jgi:hypothetical protein